ncbi:MAG: NAD-glutamate dehydrogenase [Gammaproteobacteria bacterium]|nr:NAD-glutamate dehydrogenase [Gammaproteobacteria bacterium]MDH3448690.1 NAD-glutamate dehydrogenase [Gammaproteobacteria bacterium]
MNKWYTQLFKKINVDPALKKLKLTEESFSENYQGDFSVSDALSDLEVLATINNDNKAQARLVRISRDPKNYSIKLFTLKDSIPLSQSMPMFESMGLHVLIGRPYRIKLGNRNYWINHFTLQRGDDICDVDPDNIPGFFSEMFESIWEQRSENDAFNRLLFSACIKARNVQILRAYTAYLQQIRFPHSREYIIETLNSYPDITLLLVNAFLSKFDPEIVEREAYLGIMGQIREKLQGIESLDHDLIYSRLLNLIDATVRTNYFQEDLNGSGHISFKLDSQKIEHLPKPSPRFEIYVYTSRFEGIHLRGGLVARGGIRWSDRREDYRTEVLGLMKAQMVKNAVIVPAGSKGGFITKQISHLRSSEIYGEVQTCYSLYINALLELTDNRVGIDIVQPFKTRIHDGPDPYLVVAADKGTAAFSDVANGIAKQHGFWLDDAFASGGSQGYDHKKMGITARGAWESVKRHFRGLGRNIQKENFTVIGIGDMSGDVFGNGMLLSPCIQLVAAFNHMHIFIDPSPDVKKSFEERQRMFALPRSTWNDYNKKLISRGGGVFLRSAKRIDLTPEMRHLLHCKETNLTPNELIVYILRAPVDLIWNGGIGTYVKATSETDVDVSDKSNDAIRINGRQVRARAIGEGGNLGVTQRGRIEYALSGGLIYTDSIDNSAGVNCSDKEVNIKILLSGLVKSGRLSNKDRNQLLVDMTDEVALMCLLNNYRQTQIIDSIEKHAANNMYQHARFMRHLEAGGILNRRLEYLPSDKQITDRIAKNQGLTRPELSILLSYSKLTYKNALLGASSLTEECYDQLLLGYFPRLIRERFADEILQHPLRKEIIATILSNQIANNIGIGFGSRIREETGSTIEDIAKAYVVCTEVFELYDLWRKLEKQDNVVNEQDRYDAFRSVSGLLERSISWLLRNQPADFNVSSVIERYKTDVKILREVISDVIIGQSRKNYLATRRRFIKYKLPPELAQELVEKTTMASAFDIIEIKTKLFSDTEYVARLFYALSERLQLHWIRDAISKTIVRNHWNHLAILNLRNDLHANQHNLTELVLQIVDNKRHTTKALAIWEKHHADALQRYDGILKEFSAMITCDFQTISVAVSEVRRLVQLSKREHYGETTL